MWLDAELVLRPRSRRALPWLLAWSFALWLASPAASQAQAVVEAHTPCTQRDPLRRPWFGDLHVHTRYSLDASTQGTLAGPRDAYRYARGEALGIQPHAPDGTPLRTVQLRRPLDFAAVTDHAELFGELTLCETPGLPGYDAWICRLHRRWPRASFFVVNSFTSYPERPERFGFCGPEARECRAAAATPWRVMREAAEEAHDRSGSCRFTTFVGYEWTGAPGSNNLHRNVIFRGARVPDLPISYVDAPTPEELWSALRASCIDAGIGCDVLTIPHNSNLSGGLMFRTVDSSGRPLDAASARRRAFFEPLVEVMQHKGASECRAGPGVEDELCSFESLPYTNFQGKYMPWLAEPPSPASFVREALKLGLQQRAAIGANPFEFGLVASTDTHLATPGLVDESAAYPGHGGAGAPARGQLPAGLADDVEFNPGGLAVLWAEENSRDALFDAMRRREAYGTSGPRIEVRLFGGWDLPANLCDASDFAARGYAGGVPMGAALPVPPAEAGPLRIAVRALRDSAPGATRLERVQIVKGWLEDGAVRERVLEVAGRPASEPDLRTCAVRADAGVGELCAVWTDPDFDPGQPAFYYARVLEIPTCRWHWRACREAKVECADAGSVAEGFEACCEDGPPPTIRERAWTSPIWYTPGPADLGADLHTGAGTSAAEVP